MNNRARLFLTLVISGLFLFLDRYLKHLALTSSTPISNRLVEFFNWQPSFNHGVAFSLPMPNLLIIGLTVPVLLLLGYLIFSQKNHSYFLIPVLLGALSNLYDRVIYRYIVDYFLLLTAIINIADVMIVVGFLLYIFKNNLFSSKQ